MRPHLAPCLAAGLAVAGLAPGLLPIHPDDGVGYDDTPFLPGSAFRVHDSKRPVPHTVAPGSTSGAAPADATVLFDGSDLAAWRGGSGPARWELVDGAMVVNGTGSIQTRESFGDLQLHLEWAAPEEPVSSSQGRGNSGVYLMGRYEIQILDSFENRTYADGQAAALYGQTPPLVNACRPPGEWQTYDIVFTAPRFTDGKLARPATATVLHNGVLVHNAREFIGITTHRSVATYSEHPPTGPIELQDHGNPIRFRNVWVRPIG